LTINDLNVEFIVADVQMVWVVRAFVDRLPAVRLGAAAVAGST
jgi:hypothetical protein